MFAPIGVQALGRCTTRVKNRRLKTKLSGAAFDARLSSFPENRMSRHTSISHAAIFPSEQFTSGFKFFITTSMDGIVKRRYQATASQSSNQRRHCFLPNSGTNNITLSSPVEGFHFKLTRMDDVLQAASYETYCKCSNSKLQTAHRVMCRALFGLPAFNSVSPSLKTLSLFFMT